MWKAKLNQHFAKISFLLWNFIFHSLWLSALFYFSTGTNFNSLWFENQVLFASLSITLFAYLFRDEWQTKMRDPLQVRTLLWLGFIQGAVIILLATVHGILSKKIEFLGISSQLGMNFLASYSWIFRAILLLLLCFSLNAITKLVSATWGGLFLQYFFFWIWFQPTLMDYCWIALVYFLSTNFLFSTGLMAALMIMTHAVFSSSLMGNEFSGLLQFKWVQDETSLVRSPALILGLFFLFLMNRIKVVLKKRKEVTAT